MLAICLLFKEPERIKEHTEVLLDIGIGMHFMCCGNTETFIFPLEKGSVLFVVTYLCLFLMRIFVIVAIDYAFPQIPFVSHSKVIVKMSKIMSR